MRFGLVSWVAACSVLAIVVLRTRAAAEGNNAEANAASDNHPDVLIDKFIKHHDPSYDRMMEGYNGEEDLLPKKHEHMASRETTAEPPEMKQQQNVWDPDPESALDSMYGQHQDGDYEQDSQYAGMQTEGADPHGYNGEQTADSEDNDEQIGMEYFKFEVSGTVQGVFFRKNTKKEADTLEITGWVANTNRDTVVGEAEGFGPDMKEFRLWICEIGPKLSKITGCKITDERKDIMQRQFEKFEIKYDFEESSERSKEEL